MRQKNLTDAVASSVSVPNHQRTSPHSMWDLLRRYKTDHVQSNLPTRTHDNASPDPRIWKLGPVTLDPQAWHRFGFALGHNHRKHKVTVQWGGSTQINCTYRRKRITLLHPTLPVDPLFYEDITLQELVGEIKNVNSDKSPADDGITNCMMQAAGLKFTKILHGVFSMLWVHEIQVAAWQMSLMQPIYKGEDKSEADSASYRD